MKDPRTAARALVEGGQRPRRRRQHHRRRGRRAGGGGRRRAGRHLSCDGRALQRSRPRPRSPRRRRCRRGPPIAPPRGRPGGLGPLAGAGVDNDGPARRTDMFVRSAPPPAARAGARSRRTCGPPRGAPPGAPPPARGPPAHHAAGHPVLPRLVLAVPAAAVGGRPLVRDGQLVRHDRPGHLAIFQGRPGGMLWFQPKLVDETGVATTQVLPDRLPALRAEVNEPSLARRRGLRGQPARTSSVPAADRPGSSRRCDDHDPRPPTTRRPPMGRRIRWLGVVLILCFGLVIVQLTNIQFGRAAALRTDRAVADQRRQPGQLPRQHLAADGTLLAESVPNTGQGLGQLPRLHPVSTPTGALLADVVGYLAPSTTAPAASSPSTTTSWTCMPQPAQTLSPAALAAARRPPTTSRSPSTLPPAGRRAGLLQPSSTVNKDWGDRGDHTPERARSRPWRRTPPTTRPARLDQHRDRAGVPPDADQRPDAEGFAPSYPIATERTNLPGSTFKVVTTAAVYNLMPSARPATTSRRRPCTHRPARHEQADLQRRDTAATADACGGDIQEMLPASCDPGYAELGLRARRRHPYRAGEPVRLRRRAARSTWCRASRRARSLRRTSRRRPSSARATSPGSRASPTRLSASRT